MYRYSDTLRFDLVVVVFVVGVMPLAVFHGLWHLGSAWAIYDAFR